MKKIIFIALFVVACLSSCWENPRVTGGGLEGKRVHHQEPILIGNKRPKYKPTVIVERDTVIIYAQDSILLPDCPSVVRKINYWRLDGSQNLKMLKEACDFDRAYTRKFAMDIAARYPGNFSLDQACEIFKYCMSRWGYVNDPANQEYLASASETICANLHGDCDDFAVLMASLMRSVGGETRIVTVPGHAYAELDITDFNMSNQQIIKIINKHVDDQRYISSIHYMDYDGRKWLSMDWGDGTNNIGQNYTVKNPEIFDFYTYEQEQWHWDQYKSE